MRILITGPSGAIGAALARSLGAEHELRGLSRDPSRVAADLPLELIRGDALSGVGLQEALEGVQVAYYLIHSMEPAPAAASFEQRDRVAAQRFATAAAQAGVRPDRLPRRPAAARGAHTQPTWRAAARSSGSCSRRCPTASRCEPRWWSGRGLARFARSCR